MKVDITLRQTRPAEPPLGAIHESPAEPSVEPPLDKGRQKKALPFGEGGRAQRDRVRL